MYTGSLYIELNLFIRVCIPIVSIHKRSIFRTTITMTESTTDLIYSSSCQQLAIVLIDQRKKESSGLGVKDNMLSPKSSNNDASKFPASVSSFQA